MTRIVRGWLATAVAAGCVALAGCGGSSGGGSAGVSAQALAQAALSAASPAASAASAPAAQAQPALDSAAASGAAAATAAASSTSGVTGPTQIIGGWVNDGSRKTDLSPLRPRAVDQSPRSRHVRLPALSLRSEEVRKAASGTLGAPVQIGHGRSLSETATPAQVGALLDWQASARGGQVAALRVQSTGARGVRLGLRVESLPLGGLVRFYADGSDQLYETAAQEIQAAIQRNQDAGDTSEDARTYWSPNLGGEAITVEFEVPPGVSTDTLQVAVPRLSHVFVAADELESITKAAGSCNLDVNCTTAYNDTSRSVALMDFIKGGTGYICTGTLLNDTSSSGTPWFLSANHCISDQTTATSLWTYWFYKSSSCGSTTVSSAATWMKTGATFLYGSSQTDTAFMRLNGTPPTGVLYAASSPGGLAAPANVFGVHHPAGDFQKYSEGVASGPAGTCTTINGSSCTPLNSANFWKVNWNAGTTEGGSSGSGLFTKVNGTPYLVGQLYGGYSSCSAPAADEFYGRFDKAYNAALYQWLGGTPVVEPPVTPPATVARTPIYRLYNNKTQTHFYTASADERDRTVAQYSQFTYEGIGFYAQAAQTTGNTPVYRFYNTKTGAHFYTVSTTERDNVLATLPQYSYEGVSWYVYTAAADQATAMYRFYNTETATHFYTISNTESLNVQARYPQYRYEGVGYYAWTSP